MPSVQEETIEIFQYGSPYITQIGVYTGCRRWRRYGDDGEWNDGDPPPNNRGQFEP